MTGVAAATFQRGGSRAKQPAMAAGGRGDGLGERLSPRLPPRQASLSLRSLVSGEHAGHCDKTTNNNQPPPPRFGHVSREEGLPTREETQGAERETEGANSGEAGLTE